MSALLSGEVSIAQIGGPGSISARLAGADTLIIATHLNKLDQSVMSKSPLKPEELRGKKIGITRFGSLTDFAIRYVLRRYFKMDPERDVSILQVGGQSEILASLRGGSIDAGLLSPPNNFQASRLGFITVLDIGDFDFEFPSTGLTITETFMRRNRETVKTFIKAYIETIHFMKNNRKPMKGVRSCNPTVGLITGGHVSSPAVRVSWSCLSSNFPWQRPPKDLPRRHRSDIIS